MIGRALVTGGAGFIGAHLVTRLVDDGVEVLVVDDLSTGRLARLAPVRRSHAVQIHQLDVRSPDLLRVAARFEPQVVFHLAANASVARSIDDPSHDASVNVVGTANVGVAARDAGAERVVFASTAATYGRPRSVPLTEKAPTRPMSPYGVSKLAATKYLELFEAEYGLDYVALVIANVYGPGQDTMGEAGVVAIFAEAMLSRRRPTIFGDGSATRDFVYVEDVVDAFARAGERGGARTVNVSTGTETSVMELYEALVKATGYTGKPTFAAPRVGDIDRSALDPTAARRHLRWEPFTSLPAGLRKTVDWYRRR